MTGPFWMRYYSGIDISTFGMKLTKQLFLYRATCTQQMLHSFEGKICARAGEECFSLPIKYTSLASSPALPRFHRKIQLQDLKDAL